MGNRMYSKGAAIALGISEWTLRGMAKSGKIPCWKTGNRYIFDIEQCQEYLRELAMGNVKQVQEPNQYGVLRKIKD